MKKGNMKGGPCYTRNKLDMGDDVKQDVRGKWDGAAGCIFY